jgi:hypothetical protein
MTVMNDLAWTAHWSFQMTFHTGFCETVLFDSWKVSSVGGLIGSMIGIFIMAALYEGLKYYRYFMSVTVKSLFNVKITFLKIAAYIKTTYTRAL